MNNKEIKRYSDISLDWIAHPFTGDVSPKTNIDAIRQSVRVLMSLNTYDIPFNSNPMVGIEKTLFEDFSPVTQSGLRKRIEWAISTYEKRVDVISIDIVPFDTDDGITITITYKIRALDNIQDTLIQQFQRVR